MTITKEQAKEILHQWTDDPSLLKHARSVEIVMAEAARHYGEDEEKWALTGMLHDADYQKWPEEHPSRIVAWLREQGEEEMAHAISAHYTKWGVSYETMLDKALLACDELTGFIIAYCYVRPSGINDLKAKSIKKKLKQKDFAAKVEREEIYIGIEKLGVSIDDHINLIVKALIPHAEELGIAGSNTE
jgi:predicted hydrolase (HD superfamily)